MKNKVVALFACLLLITIFLIVYQIKSRQDFSASHALLPVDCWFSSEMTQENTECYYVQVPENHDLPHGRLIKFPLVIFRAAESGNQPPVLHLGAGGPGAPMYLDDDFVIHYLEEAHDGFSTLVGRDLYVIDPRGTGLAKPLLTCDVFVQNLPERLAKNLSQREDWKLADEDYIECIRAFRQKGVQLTQYNSITISKDVELLRETVGVKQWALIGVSYGAVYAQTIAKLFPDSVEAMILDSPAFPNLKLDSRFIDRTMAPYHALYDYCNADSACSQPLDNFIERLWALYDKLSANPIEIQTYHPVTGEDLLFVLNGERFIGVLIDGVYGEDIFKDLPKIIADLEKGKHASIVRYVDDYATFLFDTHYGDLSATAHYCYDDKPYINFDALQPLIAEIPEPQIQETMRLSLEWPDLCDDMGEFHSNPLVASPLVTDIPTLFLNGKLDSITPLDDVIAQQKNFSGSYVKTFEVSHGILGKDEHVERLVADFLDDFEISKAE